MQADDEYRLRLAAAKAGGAEAPAAVTAQVRLAAKCSACNGSGTMACGACKGTGKLQSNLPCGTCSGTGLVNGHRCPSCKGERFMSSPCRLCGGRGVIACPYCRQ